MSVEPPQSLTGAQAQQSLLEIFEAVSMHHDLPSLFRHLVERLHHVAQFEGAIVLLHDADRNVMREHLLESVVIPQSPFPRELPIEAAPGGQVWQTQQPFVVTDIREEKCYPEMHELLLESRIRSYCVLPMTVGDRRLGALGFASRQIAAYSQNDLFFLQQVANLVALAVDNTLNFQSASDSQQRMARERDRLQLLLEINNAVVSALDLRQLMEVISPCLRRVVHHDFAGLLVHDPDTDQLRAHVLDFPEGPMTEGVLFSMEGTPSGLAFRSRQTVLLNRQRLEAFSSSPLVKFLRAEGVQSGVSLPLLSRDRALGVLTLMSQRDESFSAEDAELLTQIAGQIAIAVDNALNFERARKAEQEVKRQFERLRLMLEINNAVVSKLDLRSLMKTISSCLRDFLGYDVVGLALYDQEEKQLRAYAFDFPDGRPFIEEGQQVALEGSVSGLAFTTGQPVLLGHPELETFHSDFAKRFRDAGIRAGGAVPVVARGVKLGALGVANFREDSFSEDDIALLSQIANQIAVAVENALNYQRALKAEQEATFQSDRLSTVLQINNAVVSHLDLRSLIQIISVSLRRISGHDVVGLALYDPDTNQLRAYAYDSLDKQFAIEEGTPIPLESSLSGSAFITGQPVFHDRIDEQRFQSDFSKRFRAAGLQSGGVVPLIAHGRKLGTLAVASYREANLNEDEKELLCQVAGQVAIAVENALAFREIEMLKNKLASEKHYLEDELRTQHNFEELIGESQTFRRILKQVETVAPTGSTVLICGETGTGKELIARAIHDLSDRRDRTLVKINCAAIPTGLLESELFGHERGAFTGAISQRIGRFELAHRGSLFLDEVGDIPLELQPKLLRVLQEQEFERLGSTRTQKVDARLIAATNCHLEQMVADRKYRSDLYYRLNVFPITIPPLRQRREDIPALSRFFTQKYARRLKKQITTIPSDVMTALTRYSWPGNVRELEHFIERAVILTRGTDLEVSLAELKSSEPVATTELATLQDAERKHILRALEETNWVISGPQGAATRLGMKRSTLQSRMQKLGISRQR